MTSCTVARCGRRLAFGMFRDRTQAGEQLGRRVAALLDDDAAQLLAPMVLGLPRGGVVVAAEVARALHSPLDVIVVRKIGAPWQAELAIGAVADVHGRAETVLDRETIALLGVDDAYLQSAIVAEHAEALRRLRVYRGDRPPPRIAGRDVIVVDDGIATGATVRIALQVLRRERPHRLILAVPVAPPDTLADLVRDADEVVCLSAPPQFAAVGRFYQHFEQTSDEEVMALLAQDSHVPP